SQRNRNAQRSTNTPGLTNRMTLPLTLLLEHGGHTIDDTKLGIIHTREGKTLHRMFAERTSPITKRDRGIAMATTWDTPPVHAIETVLCRVVTISEALLQAESHSLRILLHHSTPVQRHPIPRDAGTL